MSNFSLKANNILTYLDGGISDEDLSLTLLNAPSLSPTGGEFFKLTLSSDNYTYVEILHCTTRTGNVCTITRGEEGTTPRAWPTGTKVELNLTAGDLSDITDTIEDLSSGTWTPTGSKLSNITDDTDIVEYLGYWSRVGDVVHFSVRVTVDVTADATLTRFYLTLPVAADFTEIFHCNGVATAYITNEASPGYISANITLNKMVVNFMSMSTDVHTVFCEGTYKV